MTFITTQLNERCIITDGCLRKSINITFIFFGDDIIAVLVLFRLIINQIPPVVLVYIAGIRISCVCESLLWLISIIYNYFYIII